MPILRTVLGDIPADQMGLTYAHQYIVIGYAGARQEMGDRFDRESVLTEICDDLGKAVEKHGVRTIVDVTPLEAGRDVDLLHGWRNVSISMWLPLRVSSPSSTGCPSTGVSWM